MVVEIVLPVARLFVLTLAGFALFKIRVLEHHLLKPVVFLTINVIFPIYFVYSIPNQWADGLAAGWIWMVVFFLAYLVMLGIQLLIAKLLINRIPLLRTNFPRELLVLFAMQNAGYIPIPLIAALAPPAVSVYMSFYVMAFIFLFFSVAVWIIQGSSQGGGFRINPPMVGILVGLLLAVTGLYGRLPGWITTALRWPASIALDLIMVVLGAILASISRIGFQFRREYGGLVLIKMLVFPALVLLGLLFVPLPGLDPAIAAGIKLALVLEAVVPPATNILVVTQAYGNRDQVEYAGSGIMFTYLAGLVLMPVFLLLARVAFG